jgi:hypothetical protein
MDDALRISYTDIELHSTKFKKDWDILTNIVANLNIEIGSHLLFCEEGFCVVEFATILSKWLRACQQENTINNFSYNSIEYEKVDLVKFERKANSWHASSSLSEENKPLLVDIHQVRNESQRFINELTVVLKGKGISINHLISGNSKVLDAYKTQNQ